MALSEKQPDGCPLRDHLLSAAARGHADSIERLEGGPELPEDMAYLWAYFEEAGRGRGDGMGGGKLTWRDLEAWARCEDRRVRPHEFLALLEIDDAVRNANSKDDEPDE